MLRFSRALHIVLGFSNHPFSERDLRDDCLERRSCLLNRLRGIYLCLLISLSVLNHASLPTFILVPYRSIDSIFQLFFAGFIIWLFSIFSIYQSLTLSSLLLFHIQHLHFENSLPILSCSHHSLSFRLQKLPLSLPVSRAELTQLHIWRCSCLPISDVRWLIYLKAFNTPIEASIQTCSSHGQAHIQTCPSHTPNFIGQTCLECCHKFVSWRVHRRCLLIRQLMRRKMRVNQWLMLSLQ